MRMRRAAGRAQAIAAGALALILGLSSLSVAQQSVGASTGLQIPRFASLRSDKVNVRQGPSSDHPVVWTFTRAGLPVEITAEFDNWRRIRDSEGSEGWVIQGLLSKRRTALVAPWEKGKTFDLFASAGGRDVRAKLESGVLVTLKSCDGKWCRIIVSEVDGFIHQDVLWGAYPNDKFIE